MRYFRDGYTYFVRPRTSREVVMVAPQGFIATDFTRVMSVFNRYTPMCTRVFLLPEWLVRFPGFLALASTSLDIISMSSEITIKHNGLPGQGFGSTAMRRRLTHTECLDSAASGGDQLSTRAQ